MDELTVEKSVLWLDFEEEYKEGSFFSYGNGARNYGSIWPDRTPQPEMWQMKKTVQPLSFTLMDATSGIVEIWNRNHFLSASYYDNSWMLECEGQVLASGKLDIHTPALQKEVVHIPYSLNDLDADKERAAWVSPSVFDAQPYMEYGVRTNERLQVQKNGQTIENLYAVGSVLSGHNAIKLADGTGVSLLTALAVAKDILKN